MQWIERRRERKLVSSSTSSSRNRGYQIGKARRGILKLKSVTTHGRAAATDGKAKFSPPPPTHTYTSKKCRCNKNGIH